MEIPRFKRIKINWGKLESDIEEEGYSAWSLAEKTDVGHEVIEKVKSDGKMNPAILEYICNLLSLNVNDYCEKLEFIRIRNGKSTSGRVAINWDILLKDAELKGYNMKSLSEAIGKSKDYLYGCKYVGGITIENLNYICEILQSDNRKYLVEGNSVKRQLVDTICNIYGI